MDTFESYLPQEPIRLSGNSHVVFVSEDADKLTRVHYLVQRSMIRNFSSPPHFYLGKEIILNTNLDVDFLTQRLDER